MKNWYVGSYEKNNHEMKYYFLTYGEKNFISSVEKEKENVDTENHKMEEMFESYLEADEFLVKEGVFYHLDKEYAGYGKVGKEEAQDRYIKEQKELKEDTSLTEKYHALNEIKEKMNHMFTNQIRALEKYRFHPQLYNIKKREFKILNNKNTEQFFQKEKDIS